MAAVCAGCGWDRGSDNCRMAHDPTPARRMWTRTEWERYQASGDLPAWDTSRTEAARFHPVGCACTACVAYFGLDPDG